MNSLFVKQMQSLLATPIEFFESVRSEDWKTAFKFFLIITFVVSLVTPIVNYLGVESTDSSSAYQAQIIAFRILKNVLLPQFRTYAYLLEFILIFVLACVILVLGAFFLHLLYRLIGGSGSFLNAWKSMCYGVAPALFGGFLPYIALFAAFYSLLLQFYMGPRVLYKAGEARAIFLLAVIVSLAFIEMFMAETTVGLFLK